MKITHDESAFTPSGPGPAAQDAATIRSEALVVGSGESNSKIENR